MICEADDVLQAVIKGSKKAGIVFRESDALQLARRIEFSSLVLRSAECQLDPVLGSAPNARSKLKASHLAAVIRNACKTDEICPMFDLTLALEKHLGILTFPMVNSDSIGGCATYNNIAFIFARHDDNVNFLLSCAHQVAHLLTMTENQRNGLWVCFCKPPIKIDERRGPRENFADAFAGELLVPEKGLGTALLEVRKQLRVSTDTVGDIELLYLARIYGVSFLTIAKRCEQLGLLPLGGALSLQVFLEKKCGGPEKRANRLDLPSRPEIQLSEVPASLNSLTRRLISERKLSANQAARALGISVKLLSSVRLH